MEQRLPLKTADAATTRLYSDPSGGSAGEVIEASPCWRRPGRVAFTINLQGGSPEGYSSAQPWHTSAIEADGSLRVDAMGRLEKILDRADDLGMAVILGLFYFGQDETVRDEAAVLKAVDNATGWVLTKGYRNVLIEVNNECNVRYDHPILRPDRVHELITRVKNISVRGHRLLTGTSYGGGTIPGEKVMATSDFILIHGNGVSEPKRIGEMVRKVRALPAYWPKPIVFNEDDHFKFNETENNFVAAVNEHASWGYFDFRMKGEGLDEGYQSPPVNWGLSSDLKRGFVQLLSIITGVAPEQTPISAGSLATPPAGADLLRPSGLSVVRLTYEGWTNAYLLGNGKVEAVIVPAVGRVMQFRFIGG